MKPFCITLAVMLALTRVQAQTPLVTTVTNQGEKITAICFSGDNQQVIYGTDKGNVLRSTLPQTRDANNIISHKPVKNLEPTITCIFSSDDGNHIFAASKDQTVTIWDATNNSQVTVSAKNAVSNSSSEFNTLVTASPDNKYFVTGSSDGIKIWDLNTRNVLHEYPFSNVSDIRITPDSKKVIASGYTQTCALILDMETGAPAGKIAPEGVKGDVGPVKSLDVSYDGRFLVTAGGPDKTVRIWNLATLKQVNQMPNSDDPIIAVKYSLDGHYLFTSSQEGKVKVYQAGNLKLKLSLNEYKEKVGRLALSRDGKFFTGCNETPEAKLFDLAWLDIKPWKPADILPPTIAMISPRLDKERSTGPVMRAYSDKPTLKVALKANDLSGVQSVEINGKPAVHSFTGGSDKYESEDNITLQENVANRITIKATDSLGNVTEKQYDVEYQKITGLAEANYHALFIACQDYTDPNIAKLDNPINDAHKLADVLKDKYTFKAENIDFLENPTRAQMISKFDELQQVLTKDDNLLIFYAGHGIFVEEESQGFWFPVDASTTNRANWFSNTSLKEYLTNIKAKHTLLIADACFSGGLFKTRAVSSDVSPAIQELYNLTSRRAMTSGSLKPVSDKSLFVEYLIRSLDNNQEDYYDSEELFNSFRKDVINDSPNHQAPQFGEIGGTGDKGGEFIFVAKKINRFSHHPQK